MRIALIGQHFLVREGLRSLLSEQPAFKFVGEVDTPSEFLNRSIRADVIVIDHLQVAVGLEGVRKLRQFAPSARILAITSRPTKRLFSDAMQAGITSYLFIDCDKEEILEAIRATAAGEQFLCGKIVSEILSATDEAVPDADGYLCDGVRISAREAEIIGLVAEGLTNKEIADRLFLSAHTVTTHRKNIMNKLGVNNTASLVLYAIRNQIVPPNHFLFNTN
jgi:DNA-binding NarL/FixJ family response regulator